jgi:four helix bundle protein
MNKIQNRKYDLEERTLKFAKTIIDLVKLLSPNIVNQKLTSQLVAAATSIGANYREANAALTKKDFTHKISISRKEAKETHYWLQLVLAANPTVKNKIEILLSESIELIKIFSAIVGKLR